MGLHDMLGDWGTQVRCKCTLSYIVAWAGNWCASQLGVHDDIKQFSLQPPAITCIQVVERRSVFTLPAFIILEFMTVLGNIPRHLRTLSLQALPRRCSYICTMGKFSNFNLLRGRLPSFRSLCHYVLL